MQWILMADIHLRYLHPSSYSQAQKEEEEEEEESS